MGHASARRSPADKYDERRRALAESALQTLGELGYARASLREIANNSDFSHGVVHYYFEDKHDLIVYCVREYKSVCVRRYDGVVASSTTAEELLSGFADQLVATLGDDAAMHRLWYDVRTQSLFEERLRDVAVEIDGWLEDMIWRIVSRYAELAGSEPAMSARGVLRDLRRPVPAGADQLTLGAEESLDELRALVHQLLPTMVKAPITRSSVRPEEPTAQGDAHVGHVPDDLVGARLHQAGPPREHQLDEAADAEHGVDPERLLVDRRRGGTGGPCRSSGRWPSAPCRAGAARARRCRRGRRR